MLHPVQHIFGIQGRKVHAIILVEICPRHNTDRDKYLIKCLEMPCFGIAVGGTGSCIRVSKWSRLPDVLSGASSHQVAPTSPASMRGHAGSPKSSDAGVDLMNEPRRTDGFVCHGHSQGCGSQGPGGQVGQSPPPNFLSQWDG